MTSPRPALHRTLGTLGALGAGRAARTFSALGARLAPHLHRHRWWLAVAGFVAYEAALHHAAHVQGGEVGALMLGAAPFVLALFAVLRSRGWHRPALAAVVLAFACLWIWRAPLALHYGWTYFLQHFGANAALAILFGRTLAAGRTPLCTRFAAAVRGTLPADAVLYTRRVTQAWTLFFVIVAGISAVMFAAGPMPAWSNFANVATPLLVVLMFVAEAACRRVALPEIGGGGMLASVREAVHGYRLVMTADADRAGLLR